MHRLRLENQEISARNWNGIERSPVTLGRRKRQRIHLRSQLAASPGEHRMARRDPSRRRTLSPLLPLQRLDPRVPRTVSTKLCPSLPVAHRPAVRPTGQVRKSRSPSYAHRCSCEALPEWPSAAEEATASAALAAPSQWPLVVSAALKPRAALPGPQAPPAVKRRMRMPGGPWMAPARLDAPLIWPIGMRRPLLLDPPDEGVAPLLSAELAGRAPAQAEYSRAELCVVEMSKRRSAHRNH
jgi:hypothetical protein